MQKPLTPEQAQEAADAYINHGRNGLQAAQALGLPRSTFDNRLRLAKRLGMLPDELPGPGFEVKEEVHTIDKDGNSRPTSVRIRPEAGPVWEMPEGFGLDKATVATDSQGRIERTWSRVSPEAEARMAMVNAVCEAVKKMKPHPVVEPPARLSKNLCNIIPLADCHIGMYANQLQSGNEYNLKIAKRYIIKNVQEMMGRMPDAHTAILILAGDTLHANDGTARTPKSKHVLDTDRTHEEAMVCAMETMLAVVSMALHSHKKVIVRTVKGNHDIDSCQIINGAMYGAYRDNKHVHIDMSDSPIFLHEHGCNMVAAIHGDEAKPTVVESMMSNENPEMWGRTTHRYAFSGHKHKEESDTFGSVKWFQVAPVAPRDRYAAGNGYSSRHGFSGFTLCKKEGLTGGSWRTFPARVAA